MEEPIRLLFPPRDYPNQLAMPEPYRRKVVWRPWLMLGLVVLCFLPRAWMALRIDVICTDATLYIQKAQAWDQGNWREGLQRYGLNPFLLALAGLHHLGADWETAGKWWNVAMASLVVLPLFGWTRRQFDDRVAVAACLLYAVHSKLIQWSPEIIRDPTFWLFFMLAVYLWWRAITEVRPLWFVAAAMALGSAAMTRFEGFFLFVPLAFWIAWRWSALRQGRARLALGLVLGVAAMPCLLLALNQVWFAQNSLEKLIRMSPFTQLGGWIASLQYGSANHGGNTITLLTFGQTMERYVLSFGRALTVIQLLLLVVGIFARRDICLRRDNRPLLYFALTVLAAMWIDVSPGYVSTTRYALPVMFLGFPFAALGLLATSEWFARAMSRLSTTEQRQRMVVSTPLILVAIIGVAAGLRDRYEGRKAQAELGYWTRNAFGVNAVVAGHGGVGVITAYYAGGRFEPIDRKVNNPQFIEFLNEIRPQVVLLSSKKLGPDLSRQLLEQFQRVGFARVDQSRLPASAENIFVLVRGRPDLITASLPLKTLDAVGVDCAKR